MSDNEMFWERVNAALDERRDPLADEQVQTLVAEDPSRLEELLALRERIARLPSSRARRWTSKVASLAAAVLAASAAVWFAMRESNEQVAGAPAVVNPPIAANDSAAQGSCVISFEAHVVIESANSRSKIDTDGEHVVRTREFHSEPSADDSIAQPAFIASIVNLNP